MFRHWNKKGCFCRQSLVASRGKRFCSLFFITEINCFVASIFTFKNNFLRISKSPEGGHTTITCPRPPQFRNEAAGSASISACSVCDNANLRAGIKSPARKTNTPGCRSLSRPADVPLGSRPDTPRCKLRHYKAISLSLAAPRLELSGSRPPAPPVDSQGF